MKSTTQFLGKSNYDKRKLSDLVSVGPAALKDFAVLGINNIQDLKRKNSLKLYKKLCKLTNTSHDLCVIDVFQAAIEQAQNSNLPSQQKNWWYWNRLKTGKIKTKQ